MKKIHKKAAALVFAAAMAGLPMGTALGSLGTMTVWAEEAEGAKAPSETQEEMQTETQEETVAETTAEQPEVQITFTTPEGWQAEKATVGIQVEDTKNTGGFSIAKVEARISENGGWTDVTQSMSVEVTANSSVYVRVTDQNGETYEQNRYIECFDKTKPTLSAAAKNGALLIQGADEGSGVAAIYVNGNEFTELTNGALQVRLQKADTTYQYFTLQVRDNAGNISENYKVANPYYEDPEAVKETPSGTGEEQKNNSLPADANATPPTSAKADVTEHQTTGNTSAEPTEPENVDTDIGRVQEVPSGTEKSGKEFYTIQTKSDKVFYLIIDNEKTDENVYLLTEVSENDLLNFTDSNMVTLPQNNAIQETALPLEKEENTEETEPEPTEKPKPEKEPEKKSENNSGTMLIMLLVLGAVGGGYYYLKFVKGKNGSFDADYDDEDEDDMEDEETFEDEEETDEEPGNEEPEEADGEYQRTKSICKNGWGAVKTSRFPATNIKRKEVFTMEEVRNEVQNEEPETGKENESKSERFIRLAEGRVTKARMAISRLSYLSNTGNYEYTPQQVEQMFSVLEQELAEVKSGFMKTAKEEKKFSFQ